MNLCGTCKHWGKSGDWEDGTNGLRQCHGIPFVESREFSESLAVVNDGSDYAGCLKSKEDFGCVLWEEGPPPPITWKKIR